MTEEDYISRQAAINCVTFHEFRYRMVEDIKALPSVTPKEKTGKWQIIEGLGYYTCSVCKCDSDVNSSYCSNCGAKMEGEELAEFDEEEKSEVSE